ncbi:MAG: acetaldehyde dehydrogenase [Gemmatimonadetes bacterium]|jgi:acetaldehyde dehydrogenase (acetylating)|nr:acetaldehyde dehydrogenase [Gemmatimonadota bacterium]
MTARKLRVAILGSGNIGTDLLIKSVRSPLLEPTLFVGRNLSSPGMAKAMALGVPISDRSVQAFVEQPDVCDLVFDATSARDAVQHWAILKKLGKTVIDMTPANVGELCVPAVNLADAIRHQNLNMVTCGGQASVPLAWLIGQTQKDVDYVEVVSSIASRSAGPATRANLDEYIDTTENAIIRFSGARRGKAILILNPAQPCVNMQTTVFARVANPDMDALRVAVHDMVTRIQSYVPGYELVAEPMYENGRIVIMVRVQGLGDYLPTFAGNLDIINCAAIAAAEEFAKARAANRKGAAIEAA